MWTVLLSVQASVFKMDRCAEGNKTKIYIMSRGSYCTNISQKSRKDVHANSVKCSIFLLPFVFIVRCLDGWSVGRSVCHDFLS